MASKSSRLWRTSRLPDALGKPCIHQGEPDGVLIGIEDVIEFVEFAKYLQRSREKNHRNPWVSRLYPANSVGRCANSLGKILLREMPTAPSQGNARPQSGEAA